MARLYIRQPQPHDLFHRQRLRIGSSSSLWRTIFLAVSLVALHSWGTFLLWEQHPHHQPQFTMPVSSSSSSLPWQMDGAVSSPTPSTSRRVVLTRWDWTSLQRLSPLAQRMEEHQSDCTLPLANFRYRNRFGLGSDLHVYSQALCNAMEGRYHTDDHTGDKDDTPRDTPRAVRVRTAGPWIWWDRAACGAGGPANDTTVSWRSAMTCYFPQSELQCPDDARTIEMQEQQAVFHSSGTGGSIPTATAPTLTNLTRGRGRLRFACPTLQARYGRSEIRAATTEFLFTRVSEAVQAEANRQIRLVFGRLGEHGGDGGVDHSSSSDIVVPKNLITVHMRWGDKADEMTLKPVHDYVDAVQRILDERRLEQQLDGTTVTRGDRNTRNNLETVNIFLATEDPRAVQEFRQAAPSHWSIYVDFYFTEFLPHRRASYNGSPLMSQDLAGRPGLVALGSLLVAMEANDFVLTTASNWSRLLNELRRNVVHPRVVVVGGGDRGVNATRMVDLADGEW